MLTIGSTEMNTYEKAGKKVNYPVLVLNPYKGIILWKYIIWFLMINWNKLEDYSQNSNKKGS